MMTKDGLVRNDFKVFLKHHPEISVQAPQATSLARASGFNKSQVNQFFDLVKPVVQENGITPHRIFNMDESGLAVVQNVSKILAKKGKCQVSSITSQERRHTITIICCMSASGNFVPPAIIFPCVRMKPEFEDGAPPETIFSCEVNIFDLVISLSNFLI